MLRENEYPIRFPRALMNNRGIKDIIRICRTNFSKIMNSSNFDDREVHEVALNFELDMIDILEHHYKAYDILKPQDLQVVFAIVCNPYFGMIKQSFQDGTRRYLGGMMRYGETFQNMDRDAGMGGKGMMSKVSSIWGGK
jgi:hypothetical protein